MSGRLYSEMACWVERFQSSHGELTIYNCMPMFLSKSQALMFCRLWRGNALKLVLQVQQYMRNKIRRG